MTVSPKMSSLAFVDDVQEGILGTQTVAMDFEPTLHVVHTRNHSRAQIRSSSNTTDEDVVRIEGRFTVSF